MFHQLCSCQQDEYDQISHDIRKLQNDIVERRVRHPFVSGVTTNGVNYIDTLPLNNNSDTILSTHTFSPSPSSDLALLSSSDLSLLSPIPRGSLLNNNPFNDPSNPLNINNTFDNDYINLNNNSQQCTVVFAHGFSQGLGSWSENIDEILQIPGVSRVVAFDWPGMGASRRSPTDIPLRSPLSYFERYRHDDLVEAQSKRDKNNDGNFNNDKTNNNILNDNSSKTNLLPHIPRESFHNILNIALSPLTTYSSDETKEKFNNAIVTPASNIASLLFNTLDDTLSLGNYINTNINNSYTPQEAVDYFIDPLVPMWKELGLENTPVVMVGHSMGGLLASHFCYKYPGLVHGLVLASPVGVSQGMGLASEYNGESIKGQSGVVVSVDGGDVSEGNNHDHGNIDNNSNIGNNNNDNNNYDPKDSILQNTNPDIIEVLLSANTALTNIESEGTNGDINHDDLKLKMYEKENEIKKLENEKFNLLHNNPPEIEQNQEVITTMTDPNGTITTTRTTTTTYRKNDKVKAIDQQLVDAKDDLNQVTTALAHNTSSTTTPLNPDEPYLQVPNFGLRFVLGLWKANLLQPQTIMRLLPNSWARKISSGMAMRMHGDSMPADDQEVLTEYLHKILTAPPSGEYAMNSILTMDYPRREYITKGDMQRFASVLEKDQRKKRNTRWDRDNDDDYEDGGDDEVIMKELNAGDREFLKFVKHTTDFRHRLSLENSYKKHKLEQKELESQGIEGDMGGKAPGKGDSRWARKHSLDEFSHIDQDVRTPSVFARSPLALVKILPKLNIPVTFLYGDDDWLYQGDVPYIVRNLNQQHHNNADTTTSNNDTNNNKNNKITNKIELPSILLKRSGQVQDGKEGDVDDYTQMKGILTNMMTKMKGGNDKKSTTTTNNKNTLSPIDNSGDVNDISNPNAMVHQYHNINNRNDNNHDSYISHHDPTITEMAQSLHLSPSLIPISAPFLDHTTDDLIDIDSDYERKRAATMLNLNNPEVSLDLIDNAGHHLYSNNNAQFNHKVGAFVKALSVNKMKRNKEEYGVEYDPKYTKFLLNKYYTHHYLDKLKREEEKRLKEEERKNCHLRLNDAVKALVTNESARVAVNTSRDLVHGVVDSVFNWFVHPLVNQPQQQQQQYQIQQQQHQIQQQQQHQMQSQQHPQQ